MSRLNQNLAFPVATHSVPLGRRLLLSIMRWFKRCWKAACRRAQRADRVVPYY